MEEPEPERMPLQKHPEAAGHVPLTRWGLRAGHSERKAEETLNEAPELY